MTEKDTFYVEFYETIDERISIVIYNLHPAICPDNVKNDKIELGIFNITYRAFVGVLYNFDVLRVNCQEDNRHVLVGVETEKSMEEVARIINDFFSLMTNKE